MKVWLVIVILFGSVAANACDICGAYLSLYPEDRADYVSLLYKNRTMSGALYPSFTGPKHSSPQFQHGDYLELYSTLEMRANLFVAENVSILASLPWVNRYRSVDRTRMADTYGLGDPLLMGNYIAVNTVGSESFTGWRHRLSLGAGIKFPLGRTDRTYDGELLDRDMQAGTGTWDVLYSLTYAIRKGKFGTGLQVIGAIACYDSDGNKYGNNYNISVEPFYLISSGTTTFAPFMGVYMEMYADEWEGREMVEETSGSVLFSKTGFRVWRGKWSVQAEVQFALAEERAETVPPNKYRVVAGLSYFLTNRKEK